MPAPGVICCVGLAPGPAPRGGAMFVQMRSPFGGRWLKIDAENGSIVDFAEVAWRDIPHMSAIAMPLAYAIARFPLGLTHRARPYAHANRFEHPGSRQPRIA